MKQIAGAILVCNNQILIAQRRNDKDLGGKWEFPCGKQEDGETLENTLIREFDEEFSKKIQVDSFFMKSIYNYDGLYEICLNVYFASCDSQQITKHPEHEQVMWISAKDLASFDFCPADVPVVNALIKKCN